MKKYFLLILGFTFFSCGTKIVSIKSPQKTDDTTQFVCDTANFDLYSFFNQDRINRFQYEINKFAIDDSIKNIDTVNILFTGSSSIRKWQNIPSYFAGKEILNRGFGGSTFPELIYFADEVIFRYNPKIILIYEGDNDQYILKPYQILECACFLEKKIHSQLPEAKILFLSVKPSPARADKIRDMYLTNTLLKNYSDTTPNTLYINVWDKMFDENGNIISNIFKRDSLHLNEAGYKIWAKEIAPFL
jgi:lysophospholipase L1-like esterase